MKNIRSKSGFTLLETIVTIGVIAVAASIMVVSYLNVLEWSRQQTDLEKLSEIDAAVQEIFSYEDAFKEAKDVVYDECKLDITVPIKMDAGGKAYADVTEAELNDLDALDFRCPVTSEYLLEMVGERIDLLSGEFKRGSYTVHVEFNGAKVSDIRDFVISNDVILVSNSGSEDMYQGEGED